MRINLIRCVGNAHHPREDGSRDDILTEPEKSVFLTPELACLSADCNYRQAVYQNVLLTPELSCLSADCNCRQAVYQNVLLTPELACLSVDCNCRQAVY